MAFTEFYCQSGGSNLNAGSTNNNTAAYTSTNGGWANSTRVFTPSDGSNPSSFISVGDYVSVFLDAATVAVFIGKVTAVQNAANGTITMSSSIAAGSNPTTAGSGMTIKAGGAWKGPNAASGFPFTLAALGNMKGANSTPVRVNMKNDATYSITASFAITSSGSVFLIQGYSSSVGDGGKATIDGSTSTAVILTDNGISGNTIVDIIFSTSTTSGSSAMVNAIRVGYFIRCEFSGARGFGMTLGSGGKAIECEFYDCNKSNTGSQGAIQLNASDAHRCYFHDNSGSNSSGAVIIGGPCAITSCIFDTNGQYGISDTTSSSNGLMLIANCDFYNNGSDGININSSCVNPHWIENCNFIKNTGAGINNASTTISFGFVYNCGYGAGTQANGSADTLGLLVKTGTVTYASNISPYSDAANGVFTLTDTDAQSAGRGVFTQALGGVTGTMVGYPDIGAVQALISSSETSHSFG